MKTTRSETADTNDDLPTFPGLRGGNSGDTTVVFNNRIVLPSGGPVANDVRATMFPSAIARAAKPAAPKRPAFGPMAHQRAYAAEMAALGIIVPVINL